MGTVYERFFAKVDRHNGPVPEVAPELGPCWRWTGAHNTFGYGTFWLDGHRLNAHRLMYAFYYMVDVSGLLVLHRCGNGHRGCVRPDHLKLGNHKMNMQDAVRHGRLPGKPAQNTEG